MCSPVGRGSSHLGSSPPPTCVCIALGASLCQRRSSSSPFPYGVCVAVGRCRGRRRASSPSLLLRACAPLSCRVRAPGNCVARTYCCLRGRWGGCRGLCRFINNTPMLASPVFGRSSDGCFAPTRVARLQLLRPSLRCRPCLLPACASFRESTSVCALAGAARWRVRHFCRPRPRLRARALIAPVRMGRRVAGSPTKRLVYWRPRSS